jgi:hypothetical protein
MPETQPSQHLSAADCESALVQSSSHLSIRGDDSLRRLESIRASAQPTEKLYNPETSGLTDDLTDRL